MKKVLGVLFILILLTAVISYAQENKDNKDANVVHPEKGNLVVAFENLYQSFMKSSLPHSLDKFFKTQQPEVPGSEWLGEMFTLSGTFEGIATNLQEGDRVNATASYNAFANEYKNVSKKVPEWRGYFDIKTVDKLGKDLKSKNDTASFQDIGILGETCSRCHEDKQPQVWAKYNWRDFDTVNVSTDSGNLSWTPAMFALAGAFDGIGVNAAKGNQTATNNSFIQFKALYTDIKTACSNCHDTPRYYYVSDDVFAMINQTGDYITAGDLTNASINQQILGIQCYKCHVLHMPAQDMKAKMENK
jgi:cytochrome c553